METRVDFDMFEKVEIKNVIHRGKTNSISINDKKTNVRISKDIVEEANIVYGDRFDLYRKDKLFALKKAKAGILRVISSGGSFSINSKNACLEILALNGSCHENEAWVENGVIFFRPIEKEGE